MTVVTSIEGIHHGTTYGYRKGCRCGPCKAAKQMDWQEYKARQAETGLSVEIEDEQDQVAAIVADLVLKIRCDCGQWHEDIPGFQCPMGALPPGQDDF